MLYNKNIKPEKERKYEEDNSFIEVSDADLRKNRNNRIDRTNHFYEKTKFQMAAGLRLCRKDS